MQKALLIAISSAALLTANAIGTAAPIDASQVDWRLWQTLPVQHDGRVKPLDTLAIETAQSVSNQTAVVDSQTEQPLNPCALYLTMLFEWSGWDHQRGDELLNAQDVASQYAYFHHADRWDGTPLLHIEQPALKQMVGLPEHVAFVPPATLATTSIINPRTQKGIPFAAWGRSLRELKSSGQRLTQPEVCGLELCEQLETFQSQRMGLMVGIVPNPNPDESRWLSLAALMVTNFDDANDASGGYRNAQKLLRQTRTEFRNGDAKAFNTSSTAFRAALAAIAANATDGTSPFRIHLEVAYNDWAPLFYAPICMLFAVAGIVLHTRTAASAFYKAAVVAHTLGTCAMLLTLVMRAVITGHLPGTTMYETVLVVAAGSALLGLAFAILPRRPLVLMSAAVISLLVLVGANYLSSPSERGFRPLETVLRSNLWLMLHVVTISLSYAALALSMGIANVTLAHLVIRRADCATIQLLSEMTRRSIRIGVVLLAFGMAFGCIWADYAWGHFWSWDPKEVWSLISLLGYLAVLHAWNTGTLGHRGFAAWSATCFALIIVTWFGMNFTIGVGQHTYGFGTSGQGLVYLAVLPQFLFTSMVIFRSRAVTTEVAVDRRDSQYSANQIWPIEHARLRG